MDQGTARDRRHGKLHGFEPRPRPAKAFFRATPPALNRRASEPGVEFYDLYVASGLRTFSDVADAGSLRFEFEPLANAPAEPFTAVLYWFHIDVGDCSFYAMAEWPVAEDVAIDSANGA